MAPWPSSLRARLTLWYTLLLAVPVVAFALVCYVVVSRTLERRTDIFIGDALTAVAREIQAERRVQSSLRESMQQTVDEVRFRELQIAILDDKGAVIAMEAVDAGEQLDADQLRRPSPETEQELLSTVRERIVRERGLGAPLALSLTSAGNLYRVLARPFDAEGARFVLTGAYAMRDIDEVLERLREMFQLAIPVLLVGAALGGSALARRSLAPMSAMARQAAAIGERNLHERLELAGGDELVSMATTVNGLLDRLEVSFDRQRRFITDASHELRTPTAVVRTEADVTLSVEHRSEAEYRASISIIRDASRRLTRIVDDLFLLSRADSGQLVPRRDAIYLEEVVHDATRAVRSVAQLRGVDVALRGVCEAPVLGDADLLGRLVLNLLDNAIKHSPSGGTVEVAMSVLHHTSARLATSQRVAVSVIDSGPGIPEEAHSRVFERFVRLDAARARVETSTTSGAGLGLAIARRISELHGGELEIAESRPGRTEFRFILPLSEPTTTA